MENERLRLDHGEVNDRLERKVPPADFRRIESASLKVTVQLHSPEMKRLYLRLFHDMQIQVHYISVLARLKLDHGIVVAAEDFLEQVIELAVAETDRAIDQTYELLKAHGIMKVITYHTQAMEFEALVISGLSHRYLDLFLKVDQLMPMLETLLLRYVIKAQELSNRKYIFKRAIRRVTAVARASRYRLQRRINEGANLVAAQQRSGSVGA